jgi:hypothetical protein
MAMIYCRESQAPLFILFLKNEIDRKKPVTTWRFNEFLPGRISEKTPVA